jgi:hypothetical protein
MRSIVREALLRRAGTQIFVAGMNIWLLGGPRISSASRRQRGALRSIRGTSLWFRYRLPLCSANDISQHFKEMELTEQ